MKKSIRVLVVEDSEDDAFLLVRELRRGGYEPIYQRVDNAAAMEAALANQEWDVVLADQKMPLFSGLDALELLKRKQLDLPFILVSGATPEEVAVTAIKAGAYDGVVKNMLDRLVPAIERGLKEAGLRRERKYALTALQDSEERYRCLVEMCPDAILISRNERIAFINGAGLKLLHASDPQQVLGKSIFEFLNPDCQTRVKEKLRQAVESKEALFVGEQSIFRVDRTFVEVEVAAAPFPDKSNESPLSVQIVLRDITERRQAAERLQASEERFRQLAENIREVFWMTDLSKNQLLYVSPAYEQIWERSCESLYESPLDWMTAIHSDDRERVRQAALTKQATGQYNEVYRIVRPDGSVRCIEDRAFPIRSEAGDVYRIAGIAQDITARTQATEALRESEERFRSLFESAPIGIALHRADGKYIQTNAAYQKFLGYSNEELLQLGVKKVTCPDDVEEGKRLFQELRSGKRDFYQRQKRYLGKDGRVVWAQVAASAVRNPDGQLRYIISMVQDVTMQKRVADRSAAFARLAHHLSAASTPAEAGQIIVDVAAELFGWDACYLHLYSAERNLIQPILTFDTIDGCKVQVPRNSFTLDPSPLMLEVMKNGPRLINRDPSSLGSGVGVSLVPFGNMARPSASMMYVPISHGSKIIGILSIQSYTARAYNEEDLHALHALADHCAGALQRISVAEALRETEARNRALLNAIPDMMLRIRTDSTILDFKAPRPAVWPMIHLPTAGQPLSKAFPSRVVPLFLHSLRQALETGEAQTFEFQSSLKEEARAFETQMVTSGENEVLAIVRDISDRRRLEKEISEISAREQTRIGQELHDDLGQLLTGIGLASRALEQTLLEKSLPEAAQAGEIRNFIAQAINKTRDLSRCLVAVEIEARGLALALQELANNTSKLFQVSCIFQGPEPIPNFKRMMGVCLYRIAQEATHNAIKHGKAKNIIISFERTDGLFTLAIKDDGIGFSETSPNTGGIGLRIMQYRASSIGAVLDVRRASEGGTVVTCSVLNGLGQGKAPALISGLEPT